MVQTAIVTVIESDEKHAEEWDSCGGTVNGMRVLKSKIPILEQKEALSTSWIKFESFKRSRRDLRCFSSC
jgi:hypothetical protein